MVGIDLGGIETIVFIFGGLLLLIGILGGGFEVKELKIPKVGKSARIVSTIAGLIFVLLAFGIMENSPFPPPNGPNNGQIDFAIHNSLGENQISEQVTVVIDGKDIGTLTTNEHYPNSRLKVTVPKTGQCSYHLQSAAIFDNDGEMLEYNGLGQGMINVEQDKDFSLYDSFSGNTWLITMIEGTTPTSTTPTSTIPSTEDLILENVNVWDTDGDADADAWDTNGDGYKDTWDTNGDGYADTWDLNIDRYKDTWDTDGDGYADVWDTDGDADADAWDTNGNGYADAWDTNGDGYKDTWDTNDDWYADAWDTNGNRYADTWDLNFDGYADAWDTNDDRYADTWDLNFDGYADAWDTNGDGDL